MTPMELLLRFVIGGSLVVAVSLIGETRYRILAGVAVFFPAVTATGYYFLSKTLETEELRDVAIFSIMSLPTLLAFTIVFWWLIPRGHIIALTGGILVWLVTAGLVIFINNTFLNIVTV